MKRLDGKHILLADDEFSVRLAFAMMLDAAGAKVTEAANGTEALEAYRAGQFDCVVTDYSMPGMKGDALALAIKTRDLKQRVVMVSGFAECVLVNGRLPWFIDTLVPKPCGMDDLLEAVCPDEPASPAVSEAAILPVENINSTPIVDSPPQFQPVTLSAEQVAQWLRVGGKIQRFRHDAANPLAPLMLIGLMAAQPPEARLAKLQGTEALAMRVLTLMEDFCTDLRSTLTSAAPVQSTSECGGESRQGFSPVTLSASEVEEWLRIAGGDQEGRIQAFQHGVRNHLTRPRNILSQARLQPDDLAANLHKAAAAAEQAWELIRKFCQQVQEALTAQAFHPQSASPADQAASRQ